MIVGGAMRKIQAHHIYASLNQLAQYLDVSGCRAERCDNLCGT